MNLLFKCKHCKEYHSTELGDSVWFNDSEYRIMTLSISKDNDVLAVSFELKK